MFKTVGDEKVYYASYLYPYYVNGANYDDGRFPYNVNQFDYCRSSNGHGRLLLTDYGPKPFVININEATKQNNTFRTALWTGTNLQVTLMSLNVGEDIGLEMHPNVDQFLRIEQGRGIVQMGKSSDHLPFKRNVYDDSAIVIPAGTWHNLTNTGNRLFCYSVYFIFY